MITVEKATLEDVLPLIGQLDEFAESAPHTLEKYKETIGNAPTLVLRGSVGGRPAGFLIGYDRFHDDSFYCWRVGVLPQFRRRGVLRAMMQTVEEWVGEHGYNKIRLTTRNSRRAMLAYLVEEGFVFTEIIPKPSLEDYRIRVEKSFPLPHS